MQSRKKNNVTHWDSFEMQSRRAEKLHASRLIPFRVHELVEFPAVRLCHAFTARQDVDLTWGEKTANLMKWGIGMSYKMSC